MKRKIKEWLKRYLPAEIIGTFTALGAASLIHILYGNAVLTAYAGALGEAIGFFATVFTQNLLAARKKCSIENTTLSWIGYTKVIKSIALEFGPAEILDGLLLRPLLMYVFPLLIENFTVGILCGKIAGDITFYFLVILSYEFRKHRLQTLL